MDETRAAGSSACRRREPTFASEHEARQRRKTVEKVAQRGHEGEPQEAQVGNALRWNASAGPSQERMVRGRDGVRVRVDVAKRAV